MQHKPAEASPVLLTGPQRSTAALARADHLEMARRVRRRYEHHPQPRRPHLTSTLSPDALSWPPRSDRDPRRNTNPPSSLGPQQGQKPDSRPIAALETTQDLKTASLTPNATALC